MTDMQVRWNAWITAANCLPWSNSVATPHTNSNPILTYIAVAPNGGCLQHYAIAQLFHQRTFIHGHTFIHGKRTIQKLFSGCTLSYVHFPTHKIAHKHTSTYVIYHTEFHTHCHLHSHRQWGLLSQSFSGCHWLISHNNTRRIACRTC